jgi:hypothetical protein
MMRVVIIFKIPIKMGKTKENEDNGEEEGSINN